MITLYDLVFQDDRRPSPFCWRAKFALKHKGLGWRDEPVGFTEKKKIAFAQSQTLPVIHVEGLVDAALLVLAPAAQLHPDCGHRAAEARHDVAPFSLPRSTQSMPSAHGAHKRANSTTAP